MQATPVRAEDEALSFRAVVDARGIRLTVRGKRWTDRIILQNEQRLESVLKALREAGRLK